MAKGAVPPADPARRHGPAGVMRERGVVFDDDYPRPQDGDRGSEDAQVIAVDVDDQKIEVGRYPRLVEE